MYRVMHIKGDLNRKYSLTRQNNTDILILLQYPTQNYEN